MFAYYLLASWKKYYEYEIKSRMSELSGERKYVSGCYVIEQQQPNMSNPTSCYSQELRIATHRD